MFQSIKTDINGQEISIETGYFALQTDGAVMVRQGDTIVFVATVAAHKSDTNQDFFPLTVDFRARSAAAGKIPGGFFKREGRPNEWETLAARLVDRPIRPLFPEQFKCPTQVICMVFSADGENNPDILAVTGASAALMISDIPFEGPVSAIRIGYIDGAFVLNPTSSQIEKSDLDMVVCGTMDAIAMVEGGAKELPEELILEALEFGRDALKKLNTLQLELRDLVGKPKRVIVEPEIQLTLTSTSPYPTVEAVFAAYHDLINEAQRIPDKKLSYLQMDLLLESFLGCFDLTQPGVTAKLKTRFHDLTRSVAREWIVTQGKRTDGRNYDEIRPISCQIDLLPRAHGSAMFTRGQTQTIVTTTLGTVSDEQIIDDLEKESSKRFMLHYNFPSFSVGEVGILRAPGRREIGHGALAERALANMMPSEEDFPYTVRIVSDILASNGSSSMATVCGATLSLMDAGVQIKAPVAGIAMGLVKENDQTVILSDITGLEDHVGDMDFKIAGTRNGITAIQMDIKTKGITEDILRRALTQAHTGRHFILDTMLAAIPAPRPSIKPHAPRILILKINPEKISSVIGPQGKIIKKIILETGAKIDIEDDGTITIATSAGDSAMLAKQKIEALTEEAAIGKVYLGKVRRIESYGAFIEILPGLDGLLHVSNLADHRVENIRDVLNEGDEIEVKVIDIDKIGKVKLGRPDSPIETEQSRKRRSGRPNRQYERSDRDRGYSRERSGDRSRSSSRDNRYNDRNSRQRPYPRRRSDEHSSQE